MLRRSGIIALVVGTILAAISQGDVPLAGRWDRHWSGSCR
jgi:hypothetical protein